LFDLQTALEFSYPDEPYYQRLALIYHTDNVDLRVHAYRDKVYRLIDCFLGGDAYIKEKGIGYFHKKVRTTLGDGGLGRVVELLDQLGLDSIVSTAVERRNLFVHGLAKRDWRLLQSGQRIDEQITALGSASEMEQYANLTVLQQARRGDINALCDRLAQFRFDLVSEIKKDVR